MMHSPTVVPVINHSQKVYVALLNHKKNAPKKPCKASAFKKDLNDERKYTPNSS